MLRFQIRLIHKKNNFERWICSHSRLCPNKLYAELFTEGWKVDHLVNKYKNEYKIYFINEEGEVIKRYE